MSLIEEALRKIEEQNKKTQTCVSKEKIRKKNKGKILIWPIISFITLSILLYFYLPKSPSGRENYMPGLESSDKKEIKSVKPTTMKNIESSKTISNIVSSPKTVNTPPAVSEHSEVRESIIMQYKRALSNHDLMDAYHIALQNIDSINNRDIIQLLNELKKIDADKEIIELTSLLEERRKISPGIYIITGKMYEEKGANDKALEEYKKFLLAGGNEPRIYAKIGSLYDKLGEEENAIKFYREYLRRADDLKLKEAVRRRLVYLESQREEKTG